MVQSDAGKEFVSQKIQTILRKVGIDFKLVGTTDFKATVTVRYIRPIKERIWFYYAQKNSSLSEHFTNNCRILQLQPSQLNENG